MTNTEIYELLEKNVEFINGVGNGSSALTKLKKVDTVLKHILETQNKILRSLLSDYSGNTNTVRIGE